MSDNLGASPALDEDFDFSVSGTGDLDHTDGVDEVEKDLAANMAVELREYEGSNLTPTVKAQILSDARITALLDERVTEVDRESSNVYFEEDRTIRLELDVTINANGQYTLVFEV